MEAEKKESSLNDRVQSMAAIQSALMFMPDLPKFYPLIETGIANLEKFVDEYLGDNEKMIVITRMNGRTGALVLNSKLPFKLTNELEITSTQTTNPIINQYSKDEYKKKMMESVWIQTMKERYDKMDHTNEQPADESGILSMLSKLVPKDQQDTTVKPGDQPLSVE